MHLHLRRFLPGSCCCWFRPRHGRPRSSSWPAARTTAAATRIRRSGSTRRTSRSTSATRSRSRMRAARTTSLRTTAPRSAARTAATARGGNGDPSDAQWTATVTITPAMAGHQIGYHCEVHGSMGMTGTIIVNGSATGRQRADHAGLHRRVVRPDAERPRHLHRGRPEQPRSSPGGSRSLRTARSKRGSAMSARIDPATNTGDRRAR